MIKDYQKKKDAELKKLSELYKNVPDSQRKLTEKLVDNVAHMAVVLEDLQSIIAQDGASIVSTNGNGFETMQEHPAQKSYNTTIKNYTSAIRQLTELLPEEDSGDALAELRDALA